jgi:heme/copper-type cytochrome/quinol oxidase subunit 2
MIRKIFGPAACRIPLVAAIILFYKEVFYKPTSDFDNYTRVGYGLLLEVLVRGYLLVGVVYVVIIIIIAHKSKSGQHQEIKPMILRNGELVFVLTVFGLIVLFHDAMFAQACILRHAWFD